MAENKVSAILDKLSGAEIKQLASLLAKMGEGGDTILAHITPEEAAMLKANGGSGEPNPNTGLPAFEDGDGDGGDGDGAGNGGGDGSSDADGMGGSESADSGSAAPGADSTADGGDGPTYVDSLPTAPAAPAAPTTPTVIAEAPPANSPGEMGIPERTIRRASARNSRTAGVSSLRSDLSIAGGSGLTIPR